MAMRPVSQGFVIMISLGLAAANAADAGHALAEQILRSCPDEAHVEALELPTSLPVDRAGILIVVARLCPAIAEIFPEQLAAAKAAAANTAAAKATLTQDKRALGMGQMSSGIH